MARLLGKAYFELHDYIPIDFVRGMFWENSRVAWWYSQNTLLYCERGYAKTPLFRDLKNAPNLPLRIVHPHKFQEAIWRERLGRAAFELGRAIPPGSAFLLIDEGTAGNAFDCCGQVIPFPQKDGVFAGSPADSRTAIAGMHSLRPSASHAVILESAFWWMNYYSDWFDELRAISRPVVDTETIKVFEFTSHTHPPKE